MILQLVTNNQNKMCLYNIHVQLRIIQEWISANLNSLKGSTFFSIHTYKYMKLSISGFKSVGTIFFTIFHITTTCQLLYSNLYKFPVLTRSEGCEEDNIELQQDDRYGDEVDGRAVDPAVYPRWLVGKVYVVSVHQVLQADVHKSCN